MSDETPQPSSGIVLNGAFTKWALGLVGAVLLTMIGTVVATVQHHTEEIQALREFQAATNANRFTDEDARMLWERVMNYHEARTPPPEVRLLLEQLDERLDRLESYHGIGSSR